jgi:hypothetical protein
MTADRAITAYSIVGLIAVALFLGGVTGDTSDTGNGIGMAVFGALPASLAVSGRHVPGDVVPCRLTDSPTRRTRRSPGPCGRSTD